MLKNIWKVWKIKNEQSNDIVGVNNDVSMICTACKESMKGFSKGRNVNFYTPELWVPNYLNDGFYHRNSGSTIPEGWLSKFGWRIKRRRNTQASKPI